MPHPKPDPNLIVTRRHFGLFAAAGATLAATPAIGQPAPQTTAATDWMAMIDQHHRQVERLFRRMEGTRSAEDRARILNRVATALTGHSIAEEAAIYPMVQMVNLGNRSDELYREQAQVKVMLARLDAMPKGNRQFVDEFRRMAQAVAAHVEDEEQNVYPQLRRRASPGQNEKMSADYARHFERYMA